ncbi:MAG: PilZ domain-containing protein [Dissulfurispiraceae bacterium]
MKNRRSHPRIDITVKFKLRGETKGWTEEVSNISASGMRFKTDKKYNLDDIVTIDMLYHQAGMTNSYLIISGKVARVTEIQGGYETSVEFAGVDEERKSLLDKIVSIKS